MPLRRLRRVIPFGYLLLVSGVAAGLAVLGAALDRLPLVPARVGRGYGSSLLRLVSTLSTPLDALDPGAGEEPGGEGAPDATARASRRHN